MSVASLASIPSPSFDGVHLGPLTFHVYGLMYVLALVAAVAIATRRWERLGGQRALVHEVALWGFPAGLIGGRLYHLATSWNEVPHTWWGPLAVWKGGLGIWGGIAAGTLAGLVVLRRRGADVPRFMDAAAPALLVAQAIGRIGNYFNQELFGGPSSLPWALRIDPAHRPAGYVQYATFHPTFLYELVWNLALAGLLVWLGNRGRVRAPGLFALYVAGYSLGRIGEELLRVDPRPPPARHAHQLLGRDRPVPCRTRLVRPHPGLARAARAPRRAPGRADRRRRHPHRAVRLRAGRSNDHSCGRPAPARGVRCVVHASAPMRAAHGRGRASDRRLHLSGCGGRRSARPRRGVG